MEEWAYVCRSQSNKLHKNKSKSTTVQNVRHTLQSIFNMLYESAEKRMKHERKALLDSNHMKSGKLLFSFNLFISKCWLLVFWYNIIVWATISQTINATKSKFHSHGFHWNRQWICYDLCVCVCALWTTIGKLMSIVDDDKTKAHTTTTTANSQRFGESFFMINNHEIQYRWSMKRTYLFICEIWYVIIGTMKLSSVKRSCRFELLN